MRHFFVTGENHELHPAKQVQVLGKSISTPSIVVQVCGQEVDEVLYPNSKRIRATKCPERQNSLDWISFSPHLSTSIIINYYHKKDQKLRKNNGVNNTRKKNLTFLTVLGLSKKNREKGKRNQRRKTKTLHHTPWILPLYYPPMNMHVFNCFSFNFIWGIEQCGNWIFALYPNFEFYYCVNRSLQEINAQFLFVNQKFLPGYRQIEFWIFFGG